MGLILKYLVNPNRGVPPYKGGRRVDNEQHALQVKETLQKDRKITYSDFTLWEENKEIKKLE